MDHRKISYRVALAVVGSCVLIFSLVSLVVALFMWREKQEKEAEGKKAKAGEVVVAAAPHVVACNRPSISRAV
jgi:heme/copper-type cytochrome/quinol oxidase subunit 2